MFDSEQSPQKKPARWRRTSSSTRASSNRSVGPEPVGVGVQRAVGRRILEEASAQHGVELDAVVGVPVDDDAQRLDRRDAELR